MSIVCIISSYSAPAVETIRSTTSTSSLPTKHERKDSEYDSVGLTSTTTSTSTVPNSTGGVHQSNGNKPHRQHFQAQQPNSVTSTATSLTNGSMVTSEPSHSRNHPHCYNNATAASSSDVRLRQPLSSSLQSVNSSSSSKDSPPPSRQNVPSSLTSGMYPTESPTKNSTATLSSREKTAANVIVKNTNRPSLPSAATSTVTETDKLTGTCTVLSTKQATDQMSSSSSSLDRKPDKPDKITLKKVDSSQNTNNRDVSHLPVNVDSSSTSTTPPNSRKLRSARRSGSKLQRSPQPSESKTTTPSPAAPQAVSASEAQSGGSKSEGFVRKESESSIKSTDSESTSSSEKLDEREDSEAVVSPEVVEPSKSKVSHPLAKEPNTGQTVPVTPPISDTPEMKSIVLDVQKKEKDETTGSVVGSGGGGGGRGKGKKRSSRQPPKREEKPKRKERDKERERERERRERGVKEQTKQELERVDSEEFSKQRPASGESSSSNSTEQLYEDQNDQRGESQEADDEKSDVSSIPEKESSHKIRSKAVERESPKPEPPIATDHSAQPKSDKPASSKTEDDDTTTAVHVQPVQAVPSTAFKAGRGKSALAKQRSDEGHSEQPPVHRPSKKASSRKSSDKSTKVHHDALADKPKQHVPVEAPHKEAERERKGREDGEESSTAIIRPQTLPVIDVEVSEDPIVSPDSGTVETDGAPHKLGLVKGTQQVIIPTSPHELAASLLSNNSAIKRRTKQHGDKGQSTEEGQDEGDYEEDESEEGSDGDTHPASSPAIYQPMPKHPRMDTSPHKLQGPPAYHHHHHPHHHSAPPPAMSHRLIMMKPPSTLSRDAEPFYPTNFSSKSHHGHTRMMDASKYSQDYHPDGSAEVAPGGPISAPPGFSPEDTVYLQQGTYLERNYKQQQDYPSPGLGPRPRPPPPPMHHGHSGKPLTPSPPSPTFTSTAAAVDGQHYPFMEHPGIEPSQEHLPGFHTPPTHGDVPVYDGADETGYPPMGGRRFTDQRRDLPIGSGIVGGNGGLDAHHASSLPKAGVGRHVTPTGAGPYPDQQQYMAMLHHQHQQRQQQLAASYRTSRGERAPAGFTVTGQRSLWENPNAYRLQALPGSEDPSLLRHQEYLRQRSILLKLYQQEQAALEAAVAREQAKRSAETLSSLNQPYRSRSTMVSGKVDLASPIGENLWEGGSGGASSSLHDPVVGPPQGFDDPGLNESILRQRQMQHYLSGQPPAPSRSRTFSGESDIGGEFVLNPVQVPSSIGHPGLNRAPGPGTSENRAQAQRSSLDHTSSSGWPSRSRSEVSLSPPLA